jgi:hypothetical protein
MKKHGVSKGKNIAAVVIVDIIGAFAMVAIVSWLAFSGGSSDYVEMDPYAPEVHETFLVKQTSGMLEEPRVSYEVNEIKAEGIYDWCLDSLISEDVARGLPLDYRPAGEDEAGLWGTDRVYYSDWWRGRWLLAKDHYIVEIWRADPLAEGEKKQITQQLGIV